MEMTWGFDHPSQRMPVLAANAVATSQPLAAQAGLRMLLMGGNAVDAAVAAAIALTVVEPTSNGIGGDAFAIVWDGGDLHGLNSSGRSPASWTPERFAGRRRMPETGWDTVTVPGAVAAWEALSKRYGRLPFTDLFAPAIGYARDGFAVSPITAIRWAEAPRLYRGFPEFGRTFLSAGRAPAPGDTFRCPDQAATLTQIAATRGAAFYTGELAAKIVASARAGGGALTAEDLAGHQPEWVAPIAVDYAGVRLHEIPPNGQGLAALIALGLLRRLDLSRHRPESADGVHLQIEAMKIAFAEAHRHVADPATMTLTADALLSDRFLDQRAGQIRLERARPPEPQQPLDGGTVYLAAADASGMMVSMIQSNYLGFGSGVVIPGTGISLQNRGRGFSLTPGHPNRVDGGKRPFHTIIPAFVTRRGEPLMSFGVMGGHMQPQGHVQIMIRIFDHGQNPQAACDAPRWFVDTDGRIALEAGFSQAVRDDLAGRGHRFMAAPASTLFGGGQLIYRLAGGRYLAASDPRKDGQAVGY
jgi:gamma-glutamyltranspeptidase/glutathione hydrolase